VFPNTIWALGADNLLSTPPAEFFSVTLVDGVLAGALTWGHLALVHDAGFTQLERGDPVERVVALLGTPHAVDRAAGRWSNQGAVIRYVYTVYPFQLGENSLVRDRWYIGVDGSNRAVEMYYSDNGC
jgi:hypothetical protein